MGVYEDFKKFLISGSLISMAVAFVVGLAIVALITALVNDIIDPLIGAAGHVNFASLGVFPVNGSPLLGGAFLGAIINFLILMVVVFFLIAYPYQLHQDRKAARAAKAAFRSWWSWSRVGDEEEHDYHEDEEVDNRAEECGRERASVDGKYSERSEIDVPGRADQRVEWCRPLGGNLARWPNRPPKATAMEIKLPEIKNF